MPEFVGIHSAKYSAFEVAYWKSSNETSSWLCLHYLLIALFHSVCSRYKTTMAVSKPTTIIFLLAFVCSNVERVFGQSNYASHANNINYIGNGLPEETVLDGKVSDIEPCSTSFSPSRILFFDDFSRGWLQLATFRENDFSCQMSIVIRITAANEKIPKTLLWLIDLI